jgi:glycosyltransferase involved in cell wall biosynthesis
MESLKRILIITPFYHGLGGAETYCKALVKEANKKFGPDNVQIATLDKLKDEWQGTPIMKSIDLIKRLFRQSRAACWHEWPTTIHAQGLCAAVVGMILRWLGFEGKLLVTILALYDFDKQSWLLRRAVQFVLNHYDRIFVEGETGKKDLLYCKVKEDKIVTFLHWVDLDVFKPGKKHKGVNVLFVGRPIKIKGKHIIEEVERKLFYLKDLTFTYVENCPHEYLIKHYQRADILVIPSQYSEGFPRVVFEAMACGCAVIVSKCPALIELCKYCGMTEPFRENIEKLYNDKIGLISQKHWSRVYAEKYFTSKNAEVITNEY